MSRLRYFLRETFINLRRNITLTVAAVLTVAVSLALVGSAFQVRYAVNNATARWQGGIEFIIFLDPEIPGEQSDAIGNALSTHPDVRSARYVSQDEAFDEFVELFADTPELAENITAEVLPSSFRVVPRIADGQLIDSIAETFKIQPGVFDVVTAKDTVDAILSVSNRLRNVFLFGAIVLLIVAVVLIFNTIRVAMFARRREIEVMKLVGATNTFIRVPFILEGMLQGIVGGLVAVVGLARLRDIIEDLFSREELALFSNFVVPTNEFSFTVVLVVILGAAVGAIGSAVAVGRFLDV